MRSCMEPQTEGDLHLKLLPFYNNCANTCCLLTKLFAYCPVAIPSLVQVYSFDLSLNSSLAIVERLEFVCSSVWRGAFYTSNRFKRVQLIQVMSGHQEGFLKKN